MPVNKDSIQFPPLDAIEADVDFCDTYGIGPFDLTYKFVLRSYEHGSRVMEDMHAILAQEFGEARSPTTRVPPRWREASPARWRAAPPGS